MIGWYDTNDNTGGQIIELRYDGDDSLGNPIYVDERKVQKYYEKSNNPKNVEDGFLFGFKPQYL